jgi:TonB-linked SusC/RagA family outer membrane protein
MIRKLLFAVLLFGFIGTTAVAQGRVVKGKVTSKDDGSAIPGVSIVVQGTSKGTVTDVNGDYSLTLSGTEATLVFSFVGYKSFTTVVGDSGAVDVVLESDITTLNEVVVVGYGTQRKVDITGAVVQVNGADISKQPSINPISALQGKVAGVQITNSGAPGSSPEIRIRGTGTVYGNANPLYVVDGVWYDDISFLNPQDIENISVLKDASSEAIYGVRAANGVVLITTKKGTLKGRAIVTYNGFVGRQVVTNQIKMADGPQYATMINELDQTNGVTPRYANPSGYGTTDWYRQILRAATISNHQVSVSGGGEKSTYNFSFGYLAQDGTVKNNSFERYTARLQNDFQAFDFLKLGYTVTGALNNSRDIDGVIFHQLYTSAPIVPVYYADGTYGDPNDFKVGSSNNFNPQVTLDFYNQKSKNYRATGSVYAEAKFAKYFTFRTSFGGDFGQNGTDNYSPKYAATLAQRNTTSVLTVGKSETRNWLLENTVTYDNQLKDHGIKVLLGQAAQHYQFYKVTGTAQNVPNNSNGDHYLSLGDPATRFVTDEGTLSTIASYFARLNYSFKERYLLTASFRADGSSKFAGANRWGYFPSIGAGWVISEESFMQNQKIVTNLKLRASWGKIGNVSVPSNLSVLKVTQTDDLTYVGGNGATAPGASVNTLVPPTTYWERGIGSDIGLEASFLTNRLSAEVDFYNKKTEKAIFDVPVLGSLGTSGGTVIGNQATFQNQGFEFLLRWNDNINQNLSYSISANLAINDNKVLAVSTGANPIYQAVGTTGSNNWNTRTVVGQPIGQFVGLNVIGIFQSQQDIDSYKSSTLAIIQPTAKPGDFKYADINGDGIIDDKDRVVLGNPNPKYNFGINTNWNYKAFDLTLDFQGVGGVDIYNANLGSRYGTENFSKDFYDKRWHGDGTSNTYPSANIGGGLNYRSNSFFVEKGNYLRIRNIQVGYTLPSDLTNKWRMARLRVYANAQNALNFFKYRGFSPEVGGGPTKAGVDNNVYPLYATYNVGVNVTF